MEKYVGQGRVLVQSFPLGLDWSNLPLLKAYVVMIHDWLGYITAPTSARYNLNPGTSIIATAPKDAAECVRRSSHAPRAARFHLPSPMPMQIQCFATCRLSFRVCIV